MGALLTTFLYLLTAVFFYFKVMVLLHETDISIMGNLKVGALSSDDKFSA